MLSSRPTLRTLRVNLECTKTRFDVRPTRFDVRDSTLVLGQMAINPWKI